MILYCQKNNIEDPVLLKTLKEIDRETQRVSEIVEHVRAYAKNKTSRTITISTTEIVRAAIESFSRSTLGSKVEVKVLHLDECTLKCDPLEIELVLLNLMKNSSQAVEHWPNKQIELAGRELDEHYVFTVRDCGRSLMKRHASDSVRSGIARKRMVSAWDWRCVDQLLKDITVLWPLSFRKKAGSWFL